MVKLPGGFSPLNALKEAASSVPGSPNRGRDYDVFSQYSVQGGDRSPADGSLVGPQVLGASTSRSGGQQQTQNPNGDTRAVLGANASSGGSGGGGLSAADRGQYQVQRDALTGLLNSLGIQESTGLRNYQSSYDTAVAQSMANKNSGLKTYNDQEVRNNADRSRNINKVNTNTENNYNSLMRALGLGGAGVSSAAQYLVPDAVARQATGERTEAIGTWGDNAYAIDSGRKKLERDYQNEFNRMTREHQVNQDNFRQQIAQRRLDTQGQLSQIDAALANGDPSALAAARDAVMRQQQALDAIIAAARTPGYAVASVDPTAVNLSQWRQDPAAMASGQQAQDPTATDTAAYLPYLRDDEDQL